MRVLVVLSFVIREKRNSLKPHIYRRYGGILIFKNQTNYAFLLWLRKIQYKYILILVLISRSNTKKRG